MKKEYYTYTPLEVYIRYSYSIVNAEGSLQTRGAFGI